MTCRKLMVMVLGGEGMMIMGARFGALVLLLLLMLFKIEMLVVEYHNKKSGFCAWPCCGCCRGV
jgi:hypothetical protein